MIKVAKLSSSIYKILIQKAHRSRELSKAMVFSQTICIAPAILEGAIAGLGLGEDDRAVRKDKVVEDAEAAESAEEMVTEGRWEGRRQAQRRR